jgi:uncharacterized protein (TIGR03437 family)
VLRLFIAGLFSAALCLGQQSISVGNAAGVSGGVAPGSILAIQQLKPPQVIGPVDPSRVSVQVRPSGSTDLLDAPLVPSPLLSIWARLPESTPLGPADVTLTIDGQASAPVRIMVARTNFGLFTQAGNGLGSAVAQNQDAMQSPSVNKLTNPALPSQYVTLWGTGLGGATADEVKVQLGGTEIVPQFVGHAPALPGVDQINFQVPDSGVPDGCYVSLIVKTGDVVSNGASIAKASQPGPCDHPFGLSTADLATLDSGGRILFGSVHLQSDVMPTGFSLGGPSRFETAVAQFSRADAFYIGLLAQPLTADDSYFGCSLAPPSGAVGILQFLGDGDAGPALTLTGPGQNTAISQGIGLGFYQMMRSTSGLPLSFPPFFGPGVWHIDGPGGENIGSFQADVMLPPLPDWTNRNDLATIDRDQDQDVAWDPSGYGDTDVAAVTLSAGLSATGSPSAQILCRAPAPTGTLTVPSSLLQMLPLGSATLRLGIAPRPNQRVLFSLPLADGSSAQAFFDYSFSETISTQTR